MVLMRRLGRPLPLRIAVVRMLRGLGDMLCIVPALRALRVALPKAHITLVGFPSAHAFVARFSHYVDELAECPGYPGIPERQPDIQRLPEFFSFMHERSFDLAIQMHGNGVVTNPFTIMLNARMNAGFFKPGQYCPDEKHFLPYPENEPEIRRYVRLLEFLGVPSAGEALEFPLWKNDRQELSIMPETRDLWPRGYVCIHPGAHDPSRCWPAERFALVADALSDFDLRVVLTGSAGERGLTRRVAKAMRRPSIDLAGRTTIGALAVLLSNARLLVCNDTGISHIAAALHIPSVVVFTNSDPGRWAPLNISLHRAVAASNGSLASGGFSFRGGKGADGSQSLRRAAQEPIPGIEQVLTAAEDLLVKEKFYWQGE